MPTTPSSRPTFTPPAASTRAPMAVSWPAVMPEDQ